MPNAQVKFEGPEIFVLGCIDKGITSYDNLCQDLQDRLFEYFMPDMPYGTAKARTGDPDQYITDHLHELINSDEYKDVPKPGDCK